MPVLLQCLSVLPQCLFQCSYCRNVAAMLMLLAMPFRIAAIRIAAILKRIAAMLPLLHHCSNAAISKGIAAMPFGIAATPQYFPDVSQSPSTPTWAPDPAKGLAQHYMPLQEGNSCTTSSNPFIHALVPHSVDLLALWRAGQIAACLDLQFSPCRCTCGFTCTPGECSLHGRTCWGARLRTHCALAALAT